MIINPGMGQSVVAYASTDGGKSWKRVLYRSDSAGIADVVDEAER